MQPIVSYRIAITVWLVLFTSIVGCSSLTAQYDAFAYEKATSLKVEALNMMSNATQEYSQYEAAVKALQVDLEKAYEYAKGRPKNTIITKQWGLMKDPNRNLLNGFLKLWKDQGKLSFTFIAEAKNEIGLGFDQIIGMESGLIKPMDSQ